MLAFLFALLVAQAGVTTLGNGSHLVVVLPQTTPVKGVVLLIPGGSTLLKLGANGETRSGNFVIRTRGMLVDAGLAVAYMDNPADLSEAIQRLRAIAKPVVVLSTSRGTIVAAQNAARLQMNGPDLLILTSPVTVGKDSLAQVNVSRIKIPTLVTTNDNDTCRASPPSGAAHLAVLIGDNADYAHFASTELRSDPCDAFSPHGYLGIESDVLAKIVAWITGR